MDLESGYALKPHWIQTFLIIPQMFVKVTERVWIINVGWK